MQRRDFLGGCLSSSLFLAGCQSKTADESNATTGEQPTDASVGQTQIAEAPNAPEMKTMYGLISLLHATEGNRDQLAEVLLSGTKGMPGCKLYAISLDEQDETGIWITEIWDSQDSHAASLQLPSVQRAMSEGKPLIAGFGARHVVTPVGGTGIS